MRNFLAVLNIILLLIILVIVLNWLYTKIMVKRSAKVIKEDEFAENMRKAQVIDVRDRSAFDAGHILGARNVSYPMMKQNPSSFRKDQPIYLYDQVMSLSVRAANLLRKQGYTDVYILKGGINAWTGKTKVNKK
ncbi:rhodanese-like domain-containing protein [Vagococcus coleopterorum]|nr:rhodanese-like domain-containing protein [Vagococcus coleopterorum]